MTQSETRLFPETVWSHFAAHARDLPWRTPSLKIQIDGTLDTYKILVSELMLQQTQVDRVIPIYKMFLVRFPALQALADAQLGEVLKAWNGLGYNRRAQYLWQAAQAVARNFDGQIPNNLKDLISLPGVGPGTAAAIMNYGFNKPCAFVETNIRTVYLHHFFKNESDIPDKSIMHLVRETLDNEHPREWFWALMDYGAHLKKTAGTGFDKSRNYKKQSAFKGSNREMRGRIIRELLSGGVSEADLRTRVGADDRFDMALQQLKKEEIISNTGGKLQL